MINNNMKQKQTPINYNKTQPCSVKMIRCAGCNRLIDENKAYCVIKGPRKLYFCSKEEYDGGDAYREKRAEFENSILKIVRRIIFYNQEQIDYNFDDGLYNTLLVTWIKISSYERLHAYLLAEENRLRDILCKKDIDRISTRLKYLSAVIINNIKDYIPKKIGSQKIDQSKIFDNIDLDLYKPDLTPRKNMRRSMEDLEDEYGNK